MLCGSQSVLITWMLIKNKVNPKWLLRMKSSGILLKEMAI